MGLDDFGFLSFRVGADRKDRDVPAFEFDVGRPNLRGGLPRPKGAFGLSLGLSQVKDADLQELAKMKSLQTLDLHDTDVTDAGLRKLAGPRSL